jgi:hypothetical protein
MRVAEREEGMRETERTREIRWTKEMNNRIRFSLLRFIFSLDERFVKTAKWQKFRSRDV